MSDSKKSAREIELEAEVEDLRSQLRAQVSKQSSGLQPNVAAAIMGFPMVLWGIDNDGVINLSEGRSLENLGLKPGELVGTNVFDLYPDQPHLSAPIRQALGGEVGFSQVEFNDGVWENRYFPRFVGDEVVGIYGISMDISAQRLAENERRRADNKWKMLTQSAPAFIVMLDPDHNVIFANTAEKFGLSDRIYGRSVYEFFHESFHEVARENLEATFRGEHGRVFESSRSDTERVDSTGRLIWMDNRLAPLEEDGVVEAVLIIATDITAMKDAEAEKAQLQTQLFHAQKLDSLGVLAGGIAHDFNNLLVGVMGHCDLAAICIESGTSPVKHIDEIGHAAKRASELCGQLLAYAGKGHLELEQVDLSTLVEEISEILSVSLSPGELHRELLPDLWLVEADGAQLQQVIMNLITNAADSILGGQGTVSIRTGSAFFSDADLVEFELVGELSAGEYVYLDVVDTGVGMSHETRNRMFDPFFTTKPTGRGLGMAAVRGIVRGHNGSLSVQTKEGEGTSIRLFLPRSTREPAAPPEDPCMPELIGAGRTVLVVDDEPAVNRVACALLSALGFESITAGDGQEAVERYRAHADPIELVIMDLTMPVKNGLDAAEEIFGIDENARILLSSGYQEEEGELPESIAGLLRKPYRLGGLREAIILALAD